MNKHKNTRPATEKRTDAAGFRPLLIGLLSALAAGLGYAVSTLPPSPGLEALVAEHLDASGTRNPVTAVLLNFRGYDTLLELGVLLLALLGVWSLGAAPKHRASPPGLAL